MWGWDFINRHKVHNDSHIYRDQIITATTVLVSCYCFNSTTVIATAKLSES